MEATSIPREGSYKIGDCQNLESSAIIVIITRIGKPINRDFFINSNSFAIVWLLCFLILSAVNTIGYRPYIMIIK
jgi:hypothetical protein